MEASEKLSQKEEKPEDGLKALLQNRNLYYKLYPHQHEGIMFLFNAYKNGKSGAKGSRNGAILADEMGLGKSIQVILFLHCMILNTPEFKNALLVVPVSLLNDWKDKLKRWTPEIQTLIYHYSEKELPKKLRRLQKTGGILLVSYKTLIYHYKTLTEYKGMPFIWDCLIYDEAHKLKNPASKSHKIATQISAGFHILITGTPMQNNLREFWSLFSLISDTYLLGTYKTFRNSFEIPITKGIEADSGAEERALGMELLENLKKMTKSLYLRRRKDEIHDPKDQTLVEDKPSEKVLQLPKKNEYVVWIKLSPKQEATYREIVDNSSSLTFQSIHSLIVVCTHPRLNSNITEHKVCGIPLAESGKLTFMLALLESFSANGNFALVFSNYIKNLDIIQNAMTQTTWGKNAFLRIDGNNVYHRDKIVRKFQKRGAQNILLLTTSVGAEGLTLTAADRVVFADLSWNQSHDAQAVGRAHRIGQTKDVKTYRLITCGTLEETIYRRQLFKGSLTRQVVGDEQNPLRHFTQEELKAILALQETQFSSTQKQLQKQGGNCFDTAEIFGAGITSFGTAGVCGISDHGQLLSASQGEDLEVDIARKHITETVKMCQQEIEAESHLTRPQTGEDVSVKKPVNKGKIRKKKHESRKTPGLAKYKCYTSPFSGTRQKTGHLSKCLKERYFLSGDDTVSYHQHISTADNSLSVSGHMDKTSDSECYRDVHDHTTTRDTQEVSEHISKNNPITDLDKNVSSVTDLEKDISPVTDLENMSSVTDSEGMSSIIDSEKDMSPVIDSEKDMSSVIDSEKDMSPVTNVDKDISLVTDLNKDMSPVAVTRIGVNTSVCSDNKFIDPSGQKYLMKCEHRKIMHSLFESSQPSSERKSCLNHKDDEVADIGVEDNSECELKSKPIAPVLCDYSLTPGHVSLLHTPFESETRLNVKDVETADISLEANFKCGLKSKPIAPVLCDYSLTPGCVSLFDTQFESGTRLNLEDGEMPDISFEDNFKCGLKSKLIAPVLCDYSLTPGCVSLLDTPFVEKRKCVLSENFQSTPMQSVVHQEVVHRETQDPFKGRLSFSHVLSRDKGNSATPVKSSFEGRLSESGKLKSPQKRTPGLLRKQKCFPLSFAKAIRKITDLSVRENDSDASFIQVEKPLVGRNDVQITPLDEKGEQHRTPLNRNDNIAGHNTEEYNLPANRSEYRLTRTKYLQSTVSVTTDEWKYGKENHDRLLPVMCGYSPNPSAISFTSQTGKITQTCSGQRCLIIKESTDVESTPKCPMDRDIDTNQSELICDLPLESSCPLTINSGVHSVQGHCPMLEKTAILKEDLSTLFMQFTQTSVIDRHLVLQEYSTLNNSVSTSFNEDCEDLTSPSINENKLFSRQMLVLSSSESEISDASTSDHELIWEMCSPEDQFIPKKGYFIDHIKEHTYPAHAKTPETPKERDQSTESANTFSHNMRTESCSDKESGISITSNSCSNTEIKNDPIDLLEQTVDPMAAKVQLNVRSTCKQISIAKEREETPGSTDASQFNDKTDRAFGESAKLHEDIFYLLEKLKNL